MNHLHVPMRIFSKCCGLMRDTCSFKWVAFQLPFWLRINLAGIAYISLWFVHRTLTWLMTKPNALSANVRLKVEVNFLKLVQQLDISCHCCAGQFYPCSFCRLADSIKSRRCRLLKSVSKQRPQSLLHGSPSL